MEALRTLAVKFCSHVFRVVRLPAALAAIQEQPAKYVLITQSESAIVEGLLLSLAQRSGFNGLNRIDSAKPRPASFASEKKPNLNWMSMHNPMALKALSPPEAPQFFCTLNIFKVRGPVRQSPQYTLGALSLLSLLVARRMLYVMVGSPVAIPRPSTLRLLRMIKVDFYKNLKLVRGTPLQSLETQKNIVLSGQEFESELRIIAERSQISLPEARRRAERSFYELAANPRRPLYSLLAPLARFIVQRLFSEIITTGVEDLIPAVKDHTVVLVPMHRSHLDYILVGYKLFESNLNPPLVAAGMNLRFWPIGFVLRSLGGYFVKRKGRDRLHALVLKRYVTYLVKRGHMQEFFIEGGRSRTGKMLPPKLGLLSIMLESWLKGLRKDILFVPVSITYENLIEDKVFADENIGHFKKKESLISLIRAFDIFQRKYGEAVINFGKPLSLSRFWAEHSPEETPHNRTPDTKRLNREKAEPPQPAARRARADGRAVLKELGLVITHAIRNQINPSLTGLAYSALLMAPNYGLPKAQLVKTIKTLAETIMILKRAGQEIGDFTPALHSFLNGRESILGDITRGGIVQIARCLESEIFFIPPAKRLTADFYRNSLLHFFLPLSLFSLVEIMGEKISAESAARFYTTFAYDLILPPAVEFEKTLARLLEVLQHEGLLQATDHGFSFKPKACRFMIPALLQGSLESFLWVYYNLRSDHSALAEQGEGFKGAIRVFSYPKFMQALLTSFEAASYLGLVSRSEAASHSAFSSVLEALEERQIITLTESKGRISLIVLKQEFEEEMTLLARANRAIMRWQEDRSRDPA